MSDLTDRVLGNKLYVGRVVNVNGRPETVSGFDWQTRRFFTREGGSRAYPMYLVGVTKGFLRRRVREALETQIP